MDARDAQLILVIERCLSNFKRIKTGVLKIQIQLVFNRI